MTSFTFALAVAFIAQSQFSAPPSWHDPVEVAARADSPEHAADVLIAKALRWSRQVQCARFEYDLGWAHPLDRGSDLGSWAAGDGLHVTNCTGWLEFDDELRWRTGIRYPENPQGPEEIRASDGTVVYGAATGIDRYLIRTETPIERYGVPSLDKALGYDVSRGVATPLFEHMWQERRQVQVVEQDAASALLVAYLRDYPVGALRGGGAAPVAVRLSTDTGVPLAMTWFDPAGFFPLTHFELRSYDIIDGVQLPHVITRQVYWPVDPQGADLWLLGEGLDRIEDIGGVAVPRDSGMLCAFDSPAMQSIAWRVIREHFGLSGIPVEPFGKADGVTQPGVFVLEAVELNRGNAIDPAAVMSTADAGDLILDTRLQTTYRLRADGQRDPVQVDRRPVEMNTPPGLQPQRAPDNGEQLDLPDCLVRTGGTPADLGTLFVGSAASRTLELSNVGTETLTVAIERSSCGCLDPAVSTSSVLPGESCVISCGVRASPIKGVQYHSVSVRFRSAEDPKNEGFLVEMPVLWETEIPKEVQPSRIRRRLLTHESHEVEVYIRDDGGSVEEALANVECSTAEVEFIGFKPVTEHTMIARFRVTPADSPREASGEVRVTWKDPARRPDVVRYEIARLDPYRSVPGAVVIEGPGTVDVGLIAREGVHNKPARAQIVEGVLPEGALMDSSEVTAGRVALHASIAPSAAGSCVLRIFDEMGTRLADIPVAWTP